MRTQVPAPAVDPTAGHVERFEVLANRHKDAVYRQLVRMCGSKEDAEDVLVESLVKAYRAMGALHDEGAFQGWLAQIARRTCGRLRRREALAPILDSPLLEMGWRETPEDAPNPEQRALENELRGCLMKAMSRLPSIYRQVYELRDVEDQPAEVVSKRLGLSIPAVKSRLHRARKMLRDTMDGELQCMQP